MIVKLIFGGMPEILSSWKVRRVDSKHNNKNRTFDLALSMYSDNNIISALDNGAM